MSPMKNGGIHPLLDEFAVDGAAEEEGVIHCEELLVEMVVGLAAVVVL